MQAHPNAPNTIVAPVALPAPAAAPVWFRRVSWGSIFAGAAVASVLSIWLNLLGVAIGLVVFEPAADQATGYGIGAAAWILGTAIVALSCGGWVAGHLSVAPRRLDRALHGVTAWCVATLFGLYLLTSGVTAAVTGTASMLGSVAGVVVPAVGQAVSQTELPGEVQRDLDRLVQGAQQDPALRQSVAAVVLGGATAQERDRLAGELAARSDMTRAEAEQQIATWEQQALALSRQVAATGEQAADALSYVAFLGVASMFLGLCFAALGGAYSHRKGRDGELYAPGELAVGHP